MTDREKRTTISVGKLMLARVKMHAAATGRTNGEVIDALVAEHVPDYQAVTSNAAKDTTEKRK